MDALHQWAVPRSLHAGTVRSADQWQVGRHSQPFGSSKIALIAPCCAPCTAGCSGHAVIDHFEYDGKLGAEDHATVLARDAVQSAAVLPGGLQGPVLYRGIGLSVAPDSETVSSGWWKAGDGGCGGVGWGWQWDGQLCCLTA